MRSKTRRLGILTSNLPKPLRFDWPMPSHAATATSAKVWNAVAAHYDKGQLIELVGVIGLFNRAKRVNRFNNALEIEVTRPGWPAK